MTLCKWSSGSVFGSAMAVDVSYLSDSILVLRLFEAEGRIRRCLSGVKKRQGEHETTIRELILNSDGISVGEEPIHPPRNLAGERRLLSEN